MLSPQEYWTVLFLITGYAFWKGTVDEWAAALICCVGSVITVFVDFRSYSGVEIGVMLVDVAGLIGFVIVALRSQRFWPLWVAGLQLTSTMSHGLKLAHSDMIPRVYAAAERFWIYPIFLAIVIGTYRASRSRRMARHNAAAS